MHQHTCEHPCHHEHKHNRSLKSKIIIIVGLILLVALVCWFKQANMLTDAAHTHEHTHGIEGVVYGLLGSIETLLHAHMWLIPLMALAAGLLTSFTPCSLSSLPLLIGYVEGGNIHTAHAFRLSLVFSLGAAITFCSLGLMASWLGQFLPEGSWLYLLLGLIMLLMVLQIWNVFQFIPERLHHVKSNRGGYPGAFLAGMLGGVFSSHCAAPVLIALLTVAAGVGNALFGFLLMLLYAAGHSILALLAGLSTGFLDQLAHSERYRKLSNALRTVMGVLILLVGLYLFYLGF